MVRRRIIGLSCQKQTVNDTHSCLDIDLRGQASWAVPEAPTTRYIGWLLRANRLHGPNTSLRSGRTFAHAFRHDGQRELAPSHITRWESGKLVATHATIRRYEQLLDLPAESLVAINDALVRAYGSSTHGYLAPRGEAEHGYRRLHELLDQAQVKGAMRGAEWSELSELIALQPNLVLHPPSLWRNVIDNLLSELVVAVYEGWLQRQEAMSRLLEHPVAASHAVAACIALASDTASPAFIEPMSLLEVTGRRDATDFIFRQIEHPDHSRALHGALLAAMHKVNHRHFLPAQAVRLADIVRGFVTDPTLHDALLPLAAEVGHRLLQQLPNTPLLRRALQRLSLGSPHHTRHQPSQAPAERVISARLATTSAHDLGQELPDDTLALMIEGAVFDPHPDRRMIASMLMAATPYRLPVARAVLKQLTRDLTARAGTFPLSTLRTLTNLNVDLHRPLIQAILSKPGYDASIRHTAAWATPHCPGQDSELVWRASLATQFAIWKRDRSDLNSGTLQGIAYGIGTDGHMQLLSEICRNPQMPGPARVTASWLSHDDWAPA
ncbi:hypothetical protein [Allorhizocola rhizosphaerae]|uniref:hypothetical protein n=1 Tax=Allorhizocola rhizosphaerae TaxID=1872709 RepID=UPI0013C2B2A6|nr:hypothetical protein [Allorhizocola rhizosphaerae]